MDESLGEALPKEIERVQEIIKIYEEHPAGIITASFMRAEIKVAMEAMIKGDIVQMIQSYIGLKEWKL